ncbi:MAG: ATP-NAD kinase family protein [Candidatus Thorarchaeota archaeon]
MARKIGIIVNPIAGMGGRVGLKGTDGIDTLEKAIEMGAKPISEARTAEAIIELESIKGQIEFVACPSDMGGNVTRSCGFNPRLIGPFSKGRTTAADTEKAAKEMMKLGVDLILFAGGDGTARDICKVIDQQVPALGIPTGVKMHSGVFAINPRMAGILALEYLCNRAQLREAEVMDVSERDFRDNRLSARLYGYLRIPHKKGLVQEIKSSSFHLYDEHQNRRAIAARVIDDMNDETYYVLGPGTTVGAISEELLIEKTLLGVDVIQKKRVVAKDQNETQLLSLFDGSCVKIIVSPIGGQGFIFGRGNQQFSPDVLRRVGKENIIVIATREKILSLGSSYTLLVDTGNSEVNRMLSGFMRVIVGYNEEVIMKVVA